MKEHKSGTCILWAFLTVALDIKYNDLASLPIKDNFLGMTLLVKFNSKLYFHIQLDSKLRDIHLSYSLLCYEVIMPCNKLEA